MQKETMSRELWITPYLAGLFDGEGTIQVRKVEKKWATLRVCLGNLDKTVVDLFKEKFGGYSYECENNGKPFYRWGTESQNATNCLSRLMPYLAVKKEQAQLAIQFQALKIPRYKNTTVIERIQSFNRH